MASFGTPLQDPARLALNLAKAQNGENIPGTKIPADLERRHAEFVELFGMEPSVAVERQLSDERLKNIQKHLVAEREAARLAIRETHATRFYAEHPSIARPTMQESKRGWAVNLAIDAWLIEQGLGAFIETRKSNTPNRLSIFRRTFGCAPIKVAHQSEVQLEAKYADYENNRIRRRAAIRAEVGMIVQALCKTAPGGMG